MHNILLLVCAGLVLVAIVGVPLLALTRSPESVAVLRMRTQHASLQKLMDDRAKAAANGNADEVLSWQQCQQAGAEGCAFRHVELRQADFEHGTVHVTHPCYLVLAEDIVFNPNAEHDHRVTDEQLARGEYTQADGFALRSFFAAIFIDHRHAHHVMLDLRGHSIEQHELFAAKQAFYTHIALSPPFIPTEGPAIFSDVIAGAHNIVIKNGKLLRSSHHAIHGNAARYVYLSDLEIRDYEVAAIACNGWQQVHIDNVRMLGTADNVPELGTLSQALFILPFMERLADSDVVLRESMQRLRQFKDVALEDIAARGSIDADAHPATHKLFANVHGVSDGGSSYSLIITDVGNAVHNFGTMYTAGEGSASIVIENSRIAGTKSHAREVVATRLTDEDLTPLTGPAGDVIDFDRVISLYNGIVREDPLAHAQLSLASAVARLVPSAEDRKRNFPTLNVHPEIVEWFRSTDGGNENIAPLLATLFSEEKIMYTRNGDAMNHFNKGTVALRIDSVASVHLYNVAVDDTSATGNPPTTVLMPGETEETPKHEHPNQVPYAGFEGDVATAVLVAGSIDIQFNDLSIGSVTSLNGATYEIRQL